MHQPRKRFGQNFLQDESVIARIVGSVAPKPDDKVIEIGPGLGALTKPLLSRLHALTAVEIDTSLYPHLEKLAQGKVLHLVKQDALKVDFSAFGTNLRLIGNLPYNISTPLLFHLLQYEATVKDMHFMLQKEVVERLAALPGNGDYGRLSVMVQYHAEVSYLFDVPPEAFYPAPKVMSAVVRIEPYHTKPIICKSEKALQALVTQAFSTRRKTLANTLKPMLSREQIARLDIDPGLRPEQLSIAQFVALADSWFACSLKD